MPKAAVLGSPVAHSKSPLLHLAAYRALDLPWTYERHEVDDAGLVPFLAEHAGEFRGLSLTMPLKPRAFALAEQHDEAARATGAVNTLVFGDVLQGYNTDVVGFIEALRSADMPPAGSAAVLGTGSTARSAAYAMIEEGVSDLHLYGRRAEAVQDMQRWLEGFSVNVHTHGWSDPQVPVDVTIAAAVAGATDGLAVPERPGMLFEVIYAPWPTAFAGAWFDAGGRVLGGLDLLVHQAAQQVLLMTRVDAGNRGAIVAAMYAALGGSQFIA